MLGRDSSVEAAGTAESRTPSLGSVAGLAAAILAIFFGGIYFCLLRAWYCPQLVGATFDRLLEGSAPTPFQYRLLVPAVGRLFLWCTGANVSATVLSLCMELVAVWAVLGVTSAALWRRRLSPLWLGLFYYLMVATYVFGYGQNFLFCYDIPALFFALVGTLLITARRFGLFEALFPLAVLNRESAIFLTILFWLVERGRMEPRSLYRHVAAQVAVFAMLKLALFLLFLHNPGPGLFSAHGNDFGHVIRQGSDARILVNLRDFAHLKVFPVFGGVWLPVVLLWRRLRDLFLRRAAWLFPIVFALMLVVGNLTEFRVYTELVPLMFFMVLAVYRGGPILQRPKA